MDTIIKLKGEPKYGVKVECIKQKSAEKFKTYHLHARIVENVGTYANGEPISYPVLTVSESEASRRIDLLNDESYRLLVTILEGFGSESFTMGEVRKYCTSEDRKGNKVSRATFYRKERILINYFCELGDDLYTIDPALLTDLRLSQIV